MDVGCRFRQSPQGQTAFHQAESNSIRPGLHAASSFAQPVRNNHLRRRSGRKYTLDFQPVIRCAGVVVIWPHFPALVLCPLLRYAAPANPENPPRRCRNAIRERISCCRNEEYDAQIFPGTHLVVDRGLPDALAQQRSGTPDEQKARSRCVAVLPSGDRPGRFHHPGLPAAKSHQDHACLRSGSEEPVTVNKRKPAPVNPSHRSQFRPGEGAAQLSGPYSIGFGGVFPYGGAISSHAPDVGACRPASRM